MPSSAASDLASSVAACDLASSAAACCLFSPPGATSSHPAVACSATGSDGGRDAIRPAAAGAADSDPISHLPLPVLQAATDAGRPAAGRRGGPSSATPSCHAAVRAGGIPGTTKDGGPAHCRGGNLACGFPCRWWCHRSIWFMGDIQAGLGVVKRTSAATTFHGPRSQQCLGPAQTTSRSGWRRRCLN